MGFKRPEVRIFSLRPKSLESILFEDFYITFYLLTFNKSGIYYVIPAVSYPINVIADITPPLEDIIPHWSDIFNNGLSWLQTILMIVALIVLLIILWLLLPILKLLISGFMLLISWPFKMIGKGIKAARKSKGNKYDRRHYR